MWANSLLVLKVFYFSWRFECQKQRDEGLLWPVCPKKVPILIIIGYTPVCPHEVE
jgi:hypothetical protein